MYLWNCLPLMLAAALLPSVAHSSQDQISWNSQPEISSRTLVDVLSDDPDYTLLLDLLQRARLIPTLNRLIDSTLFAPTNDAIKRHKGKNALWRSMLDDDSFVVTDNIQEQLRQQLFYHLLNSTLPALPEESRPLVLKTLYYPRTPVEPPSREPPPHPPWMPIPGGTLGGESQRLRIATRDQRVFIGVDAFGNGGAEAIKEKVDAGNGVILGIDDVLETPPDLAHVLSRHGSLSYFQDILTPQIANLLNTTSELTLFLPVNEAWEALDPLERLYLESEYATDDLNRILNMHAVVDKKVHWSETFGHSVNLTTIDGRDLEIVADPKGTWISTAKLVHPDIYASNGVLHLVDSLLVPDGALQLTPEKYLLALNCTTFVSLIHSVNLTSFINSTDTTYTILAPRDDVLSSFGENQLPERGSPELKRMLEYHFLPGKWTPKKMENGMLVETELKEEGLDGESQVMEIEVSEGDKKGDRSIRFGGAGVIADHVEINKTIIYFVSHPLVPPVDALQTALPSLDLSSFLAAVSSVSLTETLKTAPRTTFLIPHNSAFKRLGELVSAHLLGASSKQDLESVLLHHVLDGVQYAEALRNGSQHTFPTLEGSDLTVERKPGNDSMLISASGGWAGMKSRLYVRNMLTQTGVIHELSDVLIPRSVELTAGKLVKAAKGNTMAGLVNKAGLDWILNGTAPPEGSPWADAGLKGVGWTLLCPTDDAFKKQDLTELYSDLEGLRAIISQHLIPTPPNSHFAAADDPLNNNRPLDMDDSVTYTTLWSPSSAYGDVVFKQREDGTYVVGIKGARGTEGRTDYAQVLSWGRATTGGGTGGVIQVDSLLVPYKPIWWFEYGAPSLVGVIGVISICLFFWGVRIIWMRDTTEATYEPVGGYGRDDDD